MLVNCRLNYYRSGQRWSRSCFRRNCLSHLCRDSILRWNGWTGGWPWSNLDAAGEPCGYWWARCSKAPNGQALHTNTPLLLFTLNQRIHLWQLIPIVVIVSVMMNHTATPLTCSMRSLLTISLTPCDTSRILNEGIRFDFTYSSCDPEELRHWTASHMRKLGRSNVSRNCWDRYWHG